jgi:hypothetical protein
LQSLPKIHKVHISVQGVWLFYGNEDIIIAG